MEFLGGWNKEEDDEEGDGIIFVLFFFFFFLGETLGLGLCFAFVLSFTVLVWFGLVWFCAYVYYFGLVLDCAALVI